jgi:hypothetical protein
MDGIVFSVPIQMERPRPRPFGLLPLFVQCQFHNLREASAAAYHFAGEKCRIVAEAGAT